MTARKSFPIWTRIILAGGLAWYILIGMGNWCHRILEIHVQAVCVSVWVNPLI